MFQVCLKIICNLKFWSTVTIYLLVESNLLLTLFKFFIYLLIFGGGVSTGSERGILYQWMTAVC